MIIEKENQLMVLYSMGGDSKKNERLELVKKFIPSKTQDEMEEIPVSEEAVELSFIYVLDADDKGIADRLADVSSEMSSIDGVDQVMLSENGTTINRESYSIGAFIFAEEGTETGKLEDILLPLMKEDNEVIFEDAYKYLEDHRSEKRMKRLKLKFDSEKPNEERENKKKKYYPEKSLIGVAGQLQNSGASDTVTIRHSDYLTLAKILKNKQCCEISSFFKKITAKS